jgi:hypothetical protein
MAWTAPQSLALGLGLEAPWPRPGSDFALLFEQAAMALVREMPVLAAAHLIEIIDKRLWRIVHHYVGRMLEQLDLSEVKAVGLDETAAKRGHRYVTVFLDMQRKTKPLPFAVPGRGKATVEAFSAFLAAHQGDTMIYLIGSPVGRLLDQAKST